jgi:chaperonin GroEL
MILKETTYGKEARKKLLAGVNKLNKVVSSTLGAGGRTVIYENELGQPHPTKDGVSVAKEFMSEDPVENIGINIVRQSSMKTGDIAGDGPQPVDSKVLTPLGFVRMGDLKVGDVICGTEGTHQTVDGIFDKGVKRVHKITLDDGRYAEACDIHLWSVTTDSGTKKTITTSALMDRNGKRPYYLPQTHVEFSQARELPIDPYTLGLLIGDGSLSGTGSIELSLGKNKEHVLSKIVLPEGISFNCKYVDRKNYFRVKVVGATSDGWYFKDFLLALGLFGVKSGTKFIPNEYLYSSLENRRELLRGLLDTDGHINNRGMFEYSTISKRLKDDILELSRGLGISVASYKMIRKKGSSYSDTPIYRLTERQGYKYGLKIKNVEATDRYADMMCISVSNKDCLYITDKYIPTHNTTSTVVVANAMLTKAFHLINKHNPNVTLLRGEIERVSKIAVNAVTSKSRPVTNEMLEHVATISANNDSEIGKIIAGAYLKVGVEGAVTIEQSMTGKTYTTVAEGTRLKRGYQSNVMITDQERKQAILDNPVVFLSDKKITAMDDIYTVLEVAIENKRSILIIADVEPGVMHALNVNKHNGKLKVNVLSPEGVGLNRLELLEDLAIMTGATVVCDDTGIDFSAVTGEFLGTAAKSVSTDKETVITLNIGETADAVKQRADMVRALISEHVDDQNAWHYKDRLSRLAGGVAVVHVGASTEVEMKEKRDRVEDAIFATRAALEEGIVAGGGVALLEAVDLVKSPWDWPDFIKQFITMSEKDMAIEIVVAGLMAPIATILDNADIKNTGVGVNVRTGETGDMYEMGIIDPLKVTKNCIINATSVVMTLVTTSAVINNIRG